MPLLSCVVKDKRQLSATEKMDWMRLIRSENVGPITFYRLIERFGSASEALLSLPDMARRGGLKKSFHVCPKSVVEREMEILDNLGATIIASCEPDYPPRLSHIEDAPPVISVLGHTHILRKDAVAVVGARNASLNGRRFAERLARDLGMAGQAVVSGMARGIDTSAHMGALKDGTMAVVAGGVDVVYPSENTGLYEEIRERGVIISEIEVGETPQARHFPRRNRLISGISQGVVVVEAALRSGSLITARMALEQGREVFAVPGAPMDPRARGPNELIRGGATLIQSANDILDVLNMASGTPLSDSEQIDFKGISVSQITSSELDAGRCVVEENLSSSPVAVDEIIRNCHLSAPAVSMIVLEMELAGRLERHPGNRVSLIREADIK